MKRILATAAVLLAGASLHAASAGPILIDFGLSSQRTSPDGIAWNNVDETTQHGLVDLPLLKADGSPSGIKLDVVSPFAGPNPGGTKQESLGYPLSATRDSLYANVEPFNNRADVTPVLRLSGLDPRGAYVFTFFASRLGAGDDRTTRYTVEGAVTKTADLDAAENLDRSAATGAVTPRADGTVTITLTPGPTNNNGNHFTYLGVLEIHAAE
jgi:hypothetical protein